MIRYAVDVVPGLQDLLDLRTRMLAEGTPPETVDVFMAELDEYSFDAANDEMRAAGLTEAEIVHFWTVDMHPGRDDPNSSDIGPDGELYGEG